jgi:sensor histidine kinase regulating citrate/malate metabolism
LEEFMKSVKSFLSPFSGPLTLQQRMSILVTILVIFQLGLIGMIFSRSIANMLEEQIGKRALRVAQAVSQVPEIRYRLINGDPEGRIQIVAEGIRELTGAEFVVVGDREGKRYSHPKPDRLGKFMVGGDNALALEEGKSYISKAVGTLGPSIRGKTPVFDDAGNIAGIVSVGYLIEDVKGIIRGHQRSFYPYIGLLLVVGIIGSVVIAGHFKKAILGLEPEEIAGLFTERSAILESIREGIIAIDTGRTITMANQASLENLGLDSADKITGRKIEDVFPYTGMRDVLRTGQPILDRELTIGEREMIFNMVPIIHREKISGVVATFRLKDEIDLLARELSHVREYSEMLRTQTHEYSNKLHTLAGLVQLGASKEALDLVARETSGYQNLIHFLSSAVPDPVLSAIVLGKYNRAQEMKVRLSVDEESSLSDIPQGISQDKIITILGNLLDNALEATLEVDDRDCEVHLSMTDLGNDIIIEVEDSGPGIKDGSEDNIFERGMSTKNRPHGGVGLYLVKQALENLGGHITIGESELGGVLFTVIIPKERRH